MVINLEDVQFEISTLLKPTKSCLRWLPRSNPPEIWIYPGYTDITMHEVYIPKSITVSLVLEWNLEAKKLINSVNNQIYKKYEPTEVWYVGF